ncbi:hypothetical protein BLA29_004475 [Euroglyphus maynei]|uniref:Reverse transcriptase/retrotransposon-derived protein RNase H-like domain-containing protein n=1 Tax=Euroglyphus maynei TaxID=6958 RepID=A0A1Y3B0B4_EURMA|nr:hypothetical protein BLA29_004475 [Euroglyphus maynei]
MKILNFPRPSNQKEVTTFVCMAGFYRDLVKNFAYLAKPLFDCANAKKFNWDVKEEEAFQSIRKVIERNGEVKIPDPDLKFTYEIEGIDHISGKDNVLADTLSRIQLNLLSETIEEPVDAVIQKEPRNFQRIDGRWFRVENQRKRLYVRDQKNCENDFGGRVGNPIYSYS